MDVEKVQKINALALDLMKQGLATDREDAVRQAERVFQSRSSEYGEMRQRMEDVKPQVQSSSPSAALSQDEIKTILEKNSEFLVKKLKEFEDKIKVLEEQIGSIRTASRISHTMSSPPRGSESGSDEAPKPGTVIRTERPKEEKKDDSSGHHRTGKFTGDDVSIEKFFNYSHK